MKTCVHTSVSDKNQSSSQTKGFMHGLIQNNLETCERVAKKNYTWVQIIHICIIYIPGVNQRMWTGLWMLFWYNDTILLKAVILRLLLFWRQNYYHEATSYYFYFWSMLLCCDFETKLICFDLEECLTVGNKKQCCSFVLLTDIL